MRSLITNKNLFIYVIVNSIIVSSVIHPTNTGEILVIKKKNHFFICVIKMVTYTIVFIYISKAKFTISVNPLSMGFTSVNK